MHEFAEVVAKYLSSPIWGAIALGVFALLALSFAKGLVKPFVKFLVKRTGSRLDDVLLSGKVLRQFSYMVPVGIIWLGLPFIQGLSDSWVFHLQKLAGFFFLFFMVRASSSFLGEVNHLYERRPEARRRPIKGYLQLLQLFLHLFVLVYLISWLIGRSPIVLISGLGAFGAVVLLIFRDTILSLVASVQIASNDVLRVGDWIEIPAAGANGHVIDIALHTCKIQNWDKTIVAIPTYKFSSETFKNWRGMQESGNRRIKRSINIDKGTVRFLTDDDIDRLSEIKLISKYLSIKRSEIETSNLTFEDSEWGEINHRRLTNIGTFRAYIREYLRAHPQINTNNVLMVRQLAPTPQGVPLELYCFATTTEWLVYEGIQSDIFDHLLSILPEFDLRLFQEPTSGDFTDLSRVFVTDPEITRDNKGLKRWR